jgi:hypothetical protein
VVTSLEAVGLELEQAAHQSQLVAQAAAVTPVFRAEEPPGLAQLTVAAEVEALIQATHRTHQTRTTAALLADLAWSYFDTPGRKRFLAAR